MGGCQPSRKSFCSDRRWGPGLRICLAKDGLKIIIPIGGGTKKRQQQDIDQAVALWDDYKRRKASTRQGK